MIIIPPPKYTKTRRLNQTAVLPSAPPLLLVSGSYNSGDESLTLTFDRAINIDALVGTQITVADGTSYMRTLNATDGASLQGANSVYISLSDVGPATGPDVILNADSGNGIVADDGGRWPGALELVLPFGT